MTSGFKALLFTRFMAGISFTNLFPVAGDVVAHWAPPRERGLFVGIGTSYIQLACVFTMPVSGLLSEHVGWPSVFYVHAAVLALLTVLWLLLHRDDPRHHPCINQPELALIIADKVGAKAQNTKPPYLEILRTPCIWGVYGAVVGNFLVIQFGNTFLPLYLNRVFGYSALNAGLIGTFPMVLQFISKFLTGFVTDHLHNVTDLAKVRWCNMIAFTGCAACFVGASVVPSFYPAAIVSLLVLAFGFLGLNAGGFPKSVVLVSRQFSSTVMLGVQLTLTIVMFGGSFAVPAMTSSGSAEEYNHVFWMYAVAMMASNIVFFVLAKAEPANWTK
ncbi:Protein Y51B9A.6 b [Aphelenchoides avenae]|nr:Protein Y51B9A.6 b [Aphelenchus avenae]